MAEDKVRKRKSSHRRPAELKNSRSHDTLNHENPPSGTTATADRSPDIHALRQARLDYQSKTPEERKRGMKYEYVKTTRELISEDTGKTVNTKSSRHRRRPKDDLHPITSSRPTEHDRPVKRRDDSDDEYGYEYVYEPARERHDHSKSSPHATSSRRKHRRTSSLDSTKPPNRRHIPERRRTAPLEPMALRNVTDEDDSQASDAPPLLREQHTKPTVKRRATTPATTRTRAKPSAAPTITRRKTSNILGGFFGSSAPAPPRMVSCLTCGDDEIPLHRSAKLPCDHRMCHTCLKRVFTMSVSDAAHMPPRCCTEEAIDLKHVDKLFDNDFKILWNRKFNEYKTRNRIYCPSRRCGAWIKPKYIIRDHGRKVGRCKHCGTRVCGTCSQKMHTSRECPKDPETARFAEVAKKEGWQKCYNCSATVELKEGCNHMTCRCNAEFCMVCGLKWKSCDCPWFSYEAVDAGLEDPLRLQQEVDRRRGQVVRDEEIARAMQRLAMFDNIRAERVDLMNGNFMQQAREALTANYAHAGRLLNQIMMQRDVNSAATHGAGPDDVIAIPDSAAEDDVGHRPARRLTARARRRRTSRGADE
ncbi:hypothetical protein PV10_00412 [Exophiala mesophila]|uniref:RBR-type E3 ubiquitin transferase n=2 Tax=Exophiala mesophila TaxID=212818 RepID=A0A0D2ACB4_EXOME|nr:uncharacterized protein PV10_00412 [Exophiala mesophila]KIV96563.1 hypothetical protein PV10_00412 [Exophiala mesophila]